MKKYVLKCNKICRRSRALNWRRCNSMLTILRVIMMKFQCLGGFQEVGRNAVLLETGSERLLMDYGMKVEEGEVPIPPKG
ncbi:hypothetical protein D4Q76_00660, partial [archaeon]